MPVTMPLPNPLLRPVAHVRAQFQRWWQARLPLADVITLTQRNVYILPTRPGFMLSLTLIVLLVASINYQLNLGYLLTFLLTGSSLAAVHVGHANMRGLTMHLIAPDSVFAGNSAIIGINLENPRRSTRFGLGLALLGSDHWTWTDVPARGNATVHLAFQPPGRGLHRVPALTAESRFPLGTFRVWTVWRPAAQVLVYPAPEPAAPPLPLGVPRAGIAATPLQRDGGDDDGIRAYRRGDPMKRVVWKKAAKADELVSRDTQQVQRQELWLDLQLTGTAQPERQLSRLCAWLLQAEQAGCDYGLRLGSHEIKSGHGEAHKRRCLQALALY